MSLVKTHKLASLVLSAGLFTGMALAVSLDAQARTKDNIFNSGFSAYSDSGSSRARKKKKYSLKRKYKRSKRRRKYSSRRYLRKYRTSYKKTRRARLRSKGRYNTGFSLRGSHMRLAHKGISTGCFPARLRRLIAQVHKRYGKKLIVTSGYRSPAHNRRVGGAKRSQHMHCKAVDFRVPGVSTFALARYVKSLPGVGGVGTYCGQSSIHMDVGPKRSWHWGCGKRRHKTRTVRRYRWRRSYRG